MYSKEDIKKLCPKPATFSKANQIYEMGAVGLLEIDKDEDTGLLYIDTEVEGSYDNEYHVWLEYNMEEDCIEDYECECPAYASYPGMCKHCAAVALEYLEQQSSLRSIAQYKGVKKTVKKAVTDGVMLEIIETYAMRRRLNEQKAQGLIELVPELKDSGRSYYSNGTGLNVTFKIGETDGRKYVLKSFTDFINAVETEGKYTYGKQLSFIHSKSMFTPLAWEYVEVIKERIGPYNRGYLSVGKELAMDSEMLESLMNLNLGKTLDYCRYGSKSKTINVCDCNPPVKLKLSAGLGDYFELRIPAMDVITGSVHVFVMLKGTIYRCSEEYRSCMDGFLERADRETVKTYRIAAGDMPAFVGTVVPELEKLNVLDKGDVNLEEYVPKEAEISYYLDIENGQVTARPESVYGDIKYNLLEPPVLSQEYHDRAKEGRALDIVRAYFPHEDGNRRLLYFVEKDEDKMYQLLDTGLKQLEEAGTVYTTDKFKGKRLLRSPKAQVGVALDGGLLQLSVDLDVFTRDELSGVLESYRRKKKYYKLKNGDFLNLEENAMSTVAELLDGLALPSKELTKELIQVPKFRALYIDQVLRQGEGRLQVERNPDYKSAIRDIKNVEDSDYQVPAGLAGVLRGYQKTGYRWLRTLAALGFGGILADDMGLGKTIQTITYILSRKQEGSTKKNLIICPAFLVYNWEREFVQFAPGLKVCMIVGTAQQREERMQSGSDADVWITSYDMVKRDVMLYRDIEFDTEVIDEAQNIKNQGTLAAKSVKKIQADVRFALTGTPIENRLSELWSIFDYLMRGLLGTYDKFRKNYEIPIVQGQDKELAKRLQRMISPFILRRMKGDVLKELPDKIEQVVYSRMEGEQRKLYTGHATRLMQTLQQKSGAEVQKGKLEILAELTRLRQICCDPALLYEDFEEQACKVETCMELVKEAIEGGHKVLLFSQFTSIFPILSKRLKEEKIACYELTGKTSKEERIQLMQAYNTDDVPVFLISLKAGGTGLNLTAASIVIHFDPWWNLAAQNQATDRAHRIGQENQVIVFKLIAKDTIEEKIIELQEKKQLLASQILDGEGISAASLSKDDFMEILKFED